MVYSGEGVNAMPDHPHIALPERSAVFPLPDSILFPNTLLPLLIFEPHYRLMLEDCLRGNSLITVALMRKGAPKSLLDAPTYAVAGLGRVTTVMRLPDSTSRIFLGGIARVAIRRYTQRRPYPIAEIELLESLPTEPGRMDDRRLRIVSLFRALVGDREDAAREFIARIEEMKDPEITANLISAGLDVDSHVKQRLLETLDLPERLERLALLLVEQLQQARVIRRILSRAPQNVQDN
jgi:Lon protease-like protein